MTIRTQTSAGQTAIIRTRVVGQAFGVEASVTVSGRHVATTGVYPLGHEMGAIRAAYGLIAALTEA